MKTIVEHRALYGLVVGVAGLTCGVVAAVAKIPDLALASGFFAILSPFMILTMAKEMKAAEKMIAGAAAISTLRELQLNDSRDDAAGLQRMVDAESGLPDQAFFELALESRLNAARRRLWPITVVEVEIFPDHDSSEAKLHDTVIAFAGVARLTLRGSDIACRVGTTSFALVLEDTDERGGELAVERLVSACADQDFGIRRMAAGISSYPNHGLTAQDVLSQAWIALGRACARDDGDGSSTVEVAKTTDQVAGQSTATE